MRRCNNLYWYSMHTPCNELFSVVFTVRRRHASQVTCQLPTHPDPQRGVRQVRERERDPWGGPSSDGFELCAECERKKERASRSQPEYKAEGGYCVANRFPRPPLRPHSLSSVVRRLACTSNVRVRLPLFLPLIDTA